MELPKIGSREEWLAIRLELLAKEKELSRAQAQWPCVRPV
jgi:predicted dithiol-disulfide oxidoreductase (DUF899 family)